MRPVVSVLLGSLVLLAPNAQANRIANPIGRVKGKRERIGLWPVSVKRNSAEERP